MLLPRLCGAARPGARTVSAAVGGPLGLEHRRLGRCLDEVGKPAGVRHLGYVADADRRHDNGARALAMPSFYEGFGLPAVEMLACGGAVVASTAAALAETVGQQAQLVDPHDEAGWRASAVALLTDDAWCDSLRAGAVAAAAPFTWQPAPRTRWRFTEKRSARRRKRRCLFRGPLERWGRLLKPGAKLAKRALRTVALPYAPRENRHDDQDRAHHGRHRPGRQLFGGMAVVPELSRMWHIRPSVNGHREPLPEVCQQGCVELVEKLRPAGSRSAEFFGVRCSRRRSTIWRP